MTENFDLYRPFGPPIGKFKIPLKRAGRVEDVASLVNFFCSEESNYITGQTLVVDGGLFMK